MAKWRVLTHHTREDTCPHPVQKLWRQNSNGSLPSYIPTPLFLSVLCHLAIIHESVRLRRMPTAKETKIYGMQIPRWVTKALEARSLSQLLSARTSRQAEAAARVLRDLLLFWASFLFSEDLVPQRHGGGESQTGCFCCMTLAVTHKQAKRRKTTPVLSCTTPKLKILARRLLCAKPSYSNNL